MIGNRLKTLRIDKKISQRDLAKVLGMSQTMVAMFESNKRDPGSDVLTQIADYFHVSTDYLLGRVDHISGIVLEGDKLPQKFKDKGLDAVALLKEALDENGVLTPEAEREILMLIAEHRLRMAGTPRKKAKEPDTVS